MTVEELRQLGCMAEPCDCGQELCKNWQMVSQ